MVDDASKPLENFAAHIPKMKGFHQRYMCNNKVIRLWVNMVRTHGCRNDCAAAWYTVYWARADSSIFRLD